jgi:hypothetical protein
MAMSSLRDYHSGDAGRYNHGIPSGFSICHILKLPEEKCGSDRVQYVTSPSIAKPNKRVDHFSIFGLIAKYG